MLYLNVPSHYLIEYALLIHLLVYVFYFINLYVYKGILFPGTLYI